MIVDRRQRLKHDDATPSYALLQQVQPTAVMIYTHVIRTYISFYPVILLNTQLLSQ